MKKDAFQRLSAACALLKTPREVDSLLRELLTAAEIHDLGLRWDLMELLSEGVPQREIARRLGVSLCKITRGARLMKSEKSVAARLVRDKHSSRS